jgi:hypothetical protein
MLFGMVMGYFLSALPARIAPKQQINTTTVLKQVQSLSELVTVKYVMEKVVIMEDAKWYGQDRVLLLAHGNVKAGINLQNLRPEDISVIDKTIRITLPQESITDAYLDDTKTQVIERDTGTFRTLDKDLEQNARRIAVDDIRRAARQAGILKDARERAELQLRAFFLSVGFEQVEFVKP